MQQKEDLISLNELAKLLDMNKSRLAYYSDLGLIKPVTIVGRMKVFDKQKTLECINDIIKMQKSGVKLKDMVEYENSL